VPDIIDEEIVENIKKVTRLETQMEHVNEGLKRLDAALRAHMTKEEVDRRELDRKLNTQTAIIVAIGAAVLGQDALPMLLGLL